MRRSRQAAGGVIADDDDETPDSTIKRPTKRLRRAVCESSDEEKAVAATSSSGSQKVSPSQDISSAISSNATTPNKSPRTTDAKNARLSEQSLKLVDETAEKERRLEKERQQELKHLETLSRCVRLSQKMETAIIDTLGGDNADERKEIASCFGMGHLSLRQTFTFPPGIDLTGKLKLYQQGGVHWMLVLHSCGLNGILADEMGLGKTAQTSVFLSYLYRCNKLTKPSIICCPATLVDNWMNELKYWAADLRVLKYHGAQKERLELVSEFEHAEGAEAKIPDEENLDPRPHSPLGFHVLVTSLQMLTNQWDRSIFFRNREFDYLVVDEAHNLKNADSHLFRILQSSLLVNHRLLLTGSPIQNGVAELRNLLLFLMPRELTHAKVTNALSCFIKRAKAKTLPTDLEASIMKESKSESATSATEDSSPSFQSAIAQLALQKAAKRRKLPTSVEVMCLQRILAPLILRRLKENVIADLPKKINVVGRCKMTGRQLSVYTSELQGKATELTRSLELFTEKLANPSTKKSVARHPASEAVETDGQPIEGNNKKGSKFSSGPGGDEADSSSGVPQVFVRSLLSRLRRICNHPLLYHGYYTEQLYEEFTDFFHKNVEGYREHPRQKVEEYIRSWSDFEIYQAACEYPQSLQAYIVPLSELMESAKVRRLFEITDGVKAQKRKALVFSQFTTYLDVIEEAYKRCRPDMAYVRLDGNTQISERQNMVDNFRTSEELSLFLLSTKAGGVGLNLSAADTVILMDQDYNPHNDRQAEDRVHRLGQTKDVTVYRLCCASTVEESILRCCQEKLDLDSAFGGNSDLLTAAILQDTINSAHTSSLGMDPLDRNSPSPTSTTSSSARVRSDKRDLGMEASPSNSGKRKRPKKTSSTASVNSTISSPSNSSSALDASIPPRDGSAVVFAKTKEAMDLLDGVMSIVGSSDIDVILQEVQSVFNNKGEAPAPESVSALHRLGLPSKPHENGIASNLSQSKSEAERNAEILVEEFMSNKELSKLAEKHLPQLLALSKTDLDEVWQQWKKL